MEPQSENYLKASMLLGQMFLEQGMGEAAKDRYQKIISKEKLNSKSIEAFFRLGTILEGEQKYQDALGLYENVLSVDYAYPDVKKRISEVKESISSSSGAKPDSLTDGRYHILKEIGRGGMGVVFLAKDTVLGRKVAYKELPNSLKNDQKMLESIMKEAQMVAAMNHQNIVTIHDANAKGETPYLIMEYVEGQALNQVLLQVPILPPKLIAEISIQVCAALEYAHSKNLIHRDIKPANIMTVKGRGVKVMDFGIAKIVSAAMMEGTSIKGSPPYMAPEQIQGLTVDHRLDIYALGCTMYRMTAGKPPFMEGDVCYHHCHTKPRPPKASNPKTPDLLNDIILKCIEKDPAQRYPDVRELADELKQLL